MGEAQATGTAGGGAAGARLSPNAHPAAEEPLPVSERIVLPWVVLVLLLTFVLFACAVYYLTSLPGAERPIWVHRVVSIPSVVLILLTASFGVWFILAFTGPPDSKAKRQQCFRFAYAFTIAAFVTLSFPYLGVWKPDIAGPIGLIRGCVQPPGETTAGDFVAPRSIWCQQRPENAKPDTAQKPDTSQEPDAFQINNYPWILTIGGFVGSVQCLSEEVGKEAGKDPGKEAGLEPRKAYGPCPDNDPTNPNRFSIVRNGLVVPFYVVFLAFVGGAVSLSRRIPEYQKRSEGEYKPGSDPAAPAPLRPHEVRETVVFQIMQLVSAPFIAITAYWAIAPATVPASIALAFVSGFASESILLLIRGVVDGIRPQSTRFVPTNAGQVSATTVKVRLDFAAESGSDLDAGSLQVKVNDAAIDTTPEGFAEPDLEIGKPYKVVATARAMGETLQGELTISPSADDEAKRFEVTLRKLQE